MIGVIGEALIDFIATGREGTSQNFASYVGGCGLNAATAAGRLGTPTFFLGKLSADMFGKRILSHLIDNTLLFDPDLCNAPLPSMIGFASLDAEGKADYAFYSTGTAPVCLTAEEIVNSLSENTDIRVLHIGSVSLAVKPGCDAILDAVGFYTPRPVIFLDPNVRPTVIGDFTAYRKRLFDAARLADIIKLSDEDLQLLYPDLDTENAASRLCGEAKAHIVLTRGKKGSTWISPEGFRADAPIVDLPVVDTVGAGDTFSGALLSFLHDGGWFGRDGSDPVFARVDERVAVEAMTFANAAASINCSRKGCNPPSSDEVKKLLASRS